MSVGSVSSTRSKTAQSQSKNSRGMEESLKRDPTITVVPVSPQLHPQFCKRLVVKERPGLLSVLVAYHTSNAILQHKKIKTEKTRHA
jgi:hypothetical protein